MLRALAAAALCCLLSACASTGDMGTTLGSVGAGLIAGTQANPVTPTAVYKLKASYDVVRAGLVVYRRLPWCSAAPAPCQTPAVAIQVKRADRSAMAALGALEAVSRSGSTLSLASAYAAAQRAVATAQQIATVYRIGSN